MQLVMVARLVFYASYSSNGFLNRLLLLREISSWLYSIFSFCKHDSLWAGVAINSVELTSYLHAQNYDLQSYTSSVNGIKESREKKESWL
jgi:hypothetical protein